ncbi:Protein MOR1 [Glycine soja]
MPTSPSGFHSSLKPSLPQCQPYASNSRNFSSHHNYSLNFSFRCFFFLVENQTRWRKHKRDSQISQRHQKHEEEDDGNKENPNEKEDLTKCDYDSEDQMHHNHPNSQPHVETEVLSDHGVQMSQFPIVIKRFMNLPHSSVTAIVSLERALESGENKARSALEHKPPPSNNVVLFSLLAIDAMEKAIKNKVAKAVVPTIDVMFQALSDFGAKIVPPKRILKMLPELFDHQDQNVRASSKGLTLELCRWIGKDSVKSILFETMRDTMKKELKAELVNVTGTTKPTRKIRWMSDFDGFEFSHPEYSIQGSGLLSEQDKEPKQEAVSEVVGPGPSEESGNDAPQEIDEYELVDPVDILTPLEKSGFWDGVKPTKWSEQKEVVADLTKLASTKRISPGDFSEVCRTLKKVYYVHVRNDVTWHQVKIVPILVGAVSAENEAMYGQILAKYVDHSYNFFAISQTFVTENEAALIAARGEGTQVTMEHFEAAIDRIIGGLEKRNKEERALALSLATKMVESMKYLPYQVCTPTDLLICMILEYSHQDGNIELENQDPSMTILRKLLRKVEIIKSSRSGEPNFESHHVEANDLQSVVDQYFQIRGTSKPARHIETHFGVNKELTESSTKAWLEKMGIKYI